CGSWEGNISPSFLATLRPERRAASRGPRQGTGCLRQPASLPVACASTPEKPLAWLWSAPWVEVGEQFLAGVVAEPEALVGGGVFLSRLALGDGFEQDALGFAVEALEEFHQVVRRHREVEGVAVVLAAPADVLQQAEVFAELDAEAFGGGEVLSLLQGDPEVAHGAEVVADQLVEAVSLVAVDRAGGAGHGALPSGEGTGELPVMPPCVGMASTVSLASKALSSVPGPGAFHRRRGHLYVLASRRR